VKEFKGPLNVRIVVNSKEQVVHVNRLRHLLRPEAFRRTMEPTTISVLL